MRVVRVILGFLAIVLAAPLLAGGTSLVVAAEHRAPDGTLGAKLSPVQTSGYAIVVPDIDELLRTDLPFARAGRTTVRIAASDRLAPAFVGLAPKAAVDGYLAGVAHVEIVGVGVSGSALPVTVSTVDGYGPPPSLPGQQTFWISASPEGLLHWSAGSIRGQHLALVLMGVDASAGVAISGRAAVKPGWLVPTAWAMITLGALGVVASVILLLRPLRRREVVYLVAPSQLPELTDRLGRRPEQTTQPLATSEPSAQRVAPSEPLVHWQTAGEPAAHWPAGDRSAPRSVSAGQVAPQSAAEQSVAWSAPAGQFAQPASAGQFFGQPASAGQAASVQQPGSAGQPGQQPERIGKPAGDPLAAPPADLAPGTPAPIGSGISAQPAAGGGLVPPPYRPASPGRVWASASVRAATLGELLRAPTLIAAGFPAAPLPPAETSSEPTQPAATASAPTQPAPTSSAPTEPAPTQPAPTQPAAPTRPAEPTQPALESMPASVVVPVWVYARPQPDHRPAPVALALGWPQARAELTASAPAQAISPDLQRAQREPAQPDGSRPEPRRPQLEAAQPEASALERPQREPAQPEASALE